MIIKEYNKQKALEALDKWRHNNALPEQLNSEYTRIREKFIEFSNNAHEHAVNDRKDYIYDVFMGIQLYSYLMQSDWFNLRTAANDGFWRYIAVAVMPDIIADRWGKDNDDHYVKRVSRIWPKTLWWYIHLTWQGSEDDTRNMLVKKHFTSDTAQGLVERTGKKGVFVDAYREIAKQYSDLDFSLLAKFKRISKKNDELFRALMRLNTARIVVFDPYLCDNGCKGYAASLIKDITNNL